MKKILLALVAIAATGCNYKTHTVPGAPLPWASVDYTVMGATSAEACGTYILGIDFGHLFTDTGGMAEASAADPLSAVLGLLPIGGPSPEASRALYDALEKMPEATNIYAPKIHTTVTGLSPFKIPLFGKRCAAIEARGVKLGKGPVPNAN
jgi:hypothetical protein